MFKKAKDIIPGDTVFDRGTSFVVKEISVDKEHGLITFLDTEGVFHGPYALEEYFGVNINH